MKLSHARGATQDGWVMVERSDRMWSTGEGNGKSLQCSCLEILMINLDSILKSRDITLLTKVHLVKAMVFPIVMYKFLRRQIRWSDNPISLKIFQFVVIYQSEASL